MVVNMPLRTHKHDANVSVRGSTSWGVVERPATTTGWPMDGRHEGHTRQGVVCGHKMRVIVVNDHHPARGASVWDCPNLKANYYSSTYLQHSNTPTHSHNASRQREGVDWTYFKSWANSSSTARNSNTLTHLNIARSHWSLQLHCHLDYVEIIIFQFHFHHLLIALSIFVPSRLLYHLELCFVKSITQGLLRKYEYFGQNIRCGKNSLFKEFIWGTDLCNIRINSAIWAQLCLITNHRRIESFSTLTPLQNPSLHLWHAFLSTLQPPPPPLYAYRPPEGSTYRQEKVDIFIFC